MTRLERTTSGDAAHALWPGWPPRWASHPPPSSHSQPNPIGSHRHDHHTTPHPGDERPYRARRQLGRNLEQATPEAGDPALLDNLPILGDILTGAPIRLQQELHQAFSLQAV